MNLFQASAKEALDMYEDLNDIVFDWSKLDDFNDINFLTILRRNTRTVSVREFLEKFGNSVGEFQQKVLKNSPGWFAVINHDMIKAEDYDESWMPGAKLVKYDETSMSQCAMKSGLYFFLLAAALHPSILDNLVGILCLPTQFKVPAKFSIYDYCVIDDMSYTGMQVVNTMQSISSDRKHLVCAFLGQGGSDVLKEAEINVFCQETIPKFEMYEPSRKLTLDYKYDAYPIAFSHKIADNISSFPEVYEKIVESKVTPPYKDAGQYSYYTYLVNDVVKSYVTSV